MGRPSVSVDVCLCGCMFECIFCMCVCSCPLCDLCLSRAQRAKNQYMSVQLDMDDDRISILPGEGQALVLC